MSKILLDGYRPIKRRWPVYSLDDSSGEVVTQWFANQKEGEDSGPQSGFGDYRKIGGLLRREIGFFALYASGETLYLWLNGKRVDAFMDDVVVKRGVDFLLRKRIRIYVKKELVFECRYSYLDYEDFPDEDIFWYFARSLATTERRLRIMLILQDRVNGKYRATDEYTNDLKDRVGKMLMAGEMAEKVKR